jgi:hypothetical protein
MTAITTTTTTTTGQAGFDTTAAHKPIWLVGVVAGVAAAVAAMLVAAVAKAADVPLRIAEKKGEAAEAIPLGGFATVTLGSTAVGIVLAIALARWAKRPARTFVVTTLVLTALSFASPFAFGHATTATRVVLEMTHIVAAAIVIPALAVRLAHQPSRRSRRATN